MKLSIIIPVYNVEKYLQRCIDSVINQSLKDIEIIIIDDCSTDLSALIAKDYIAKDGRIVFIQNPSNLGLSATRNIGVKKAKGEYVAYLDSDDFIDYDFYEKLYQAAIRNNADIACAGCIKKRKYANQTIIKYAKESCFDSIEDKIHICKIPKYNYVWNKIYKLSELKRANLEFVEGMAYEDMLYTIKAMYYLKRIVTVPKTNYYYCVNPASCVKTKSEKNDQDCVNAILSTIKFAKDNGLKLPKEFGIKTKLKIKFFGIIILKIYKWETFSKYFLFGFIHFLEIKKYD